MGRSRARGCRVKFRHLKRKPRSKARGDYAIRNERLPALGYSSYREYLASDEWKTLRAARLSESPYCVLCAGRACQVHHYSYFDAVILGLAPELLLPVCDDCHHLIEFDGERKRSVKQAQTFVRSFLKENGRDAAAELIATVQRNVERQSRDLAKSRARS